MDRVYNIILASICGMSVFLPTSHCQPSPYSIALETALMDELFINNSYRILQRPSQLVLVDISMTILTVNDLNIKNQQLSISGYLNVHWFDSRLSWLNPATTSQDYTSVNFLFSSDKYVWRPALVIENSINDLEVIDGSSIPMRITMGGKVIWSPAGIYDVSCESDIKYYPLDTQECTIKVSSWGYTENEVRLAFVTDPIDLSFYSANGEWDLVKAYGSDTATIARGAVTFSSISYTLKLQRRPMFHIINTLFPVALMAVLIAMVFKLPVDSGEKIGFSLTVLLAYAVYLSMISENIPSTSVSVCYLSVYLAFILTLSAVAVVLTIIVLNLHFKTDENEIPVWLITLTRCLFIKIACVQKSGNCCRPTKVNQSSDNNIVKTIKVEPKTDEDTADDNNDTLTWQRLSVIMDKVFFNVYMVLIILSTLMLFGAIVINHSVT